MILFDFLCYNNKIEIEKRREKERETLINFIKIKTDGLI